MPKDNVVSADNTVINGGAISTASSTAAMTATVVSSPVVTAPAYAAVTSPNRLSDKQLVSNLKDMFTRLGAEINDLQKREPSADDTMEMTPAEIIQSRLIKMEEQFLYALEKYFHKDDAGMDSAYLYSSLAEISFHLKKYPDMFRNLAKVVNAGAYSEALHGALLKRYIELYADTDPELAQACRNLYDLAKAETQKIAVEKHQANIISPFLQVISSPDWVPPIMPAPMLSKSNPPPDFVVDSCASVVDPASTTKNSADNKQQCNSAASQNLYSFYTDVDCAVLEFREDLVTDSSQTSLIPR